MLTFVIGQEVTGTDKTNPNQLRSILCSLRGVHTKEKLIKESVLRCV